MTDDVTVISLPPAFGPEDHATLAKVAQVPGSKVLDCVRIANVPMNLCDLVAQGWAAPHGAVPRLAVVVQIDAWPMVRMMAPRAVAVLAGHGCTLRLFYARQLFAGHVERWIASGAEPGHELAATLADLDEVWRGSPMAGMVVDAMLELIRATPERAEYLPRLASIATKFAPEKAQAITDEAVESVGDVSLD